MNQHQKFCVQLGKIMSVTRHDVFHAYDQWKRDGLIEPILRRDAKAIAKAKSKYEWFGKKHDKVKTDRKSMNDFERTMDNLSIMARAVSTIGSIENAQQALDHLK